jgi:hypothetical protein
MVERSKEVFCTKKKFVFVKNKTSLKLQQNKKPSPPTPEGGAEAMNNE